MQLDVHHGLLEDQVTFTGHQKGDDLHQWLSAIDVCVSTQTNDLVGQVRGDVPCAVETQRQLGSRLRNHL